MLVAAFVCALVFLCKLLLNWFLICMLLCVCVVWIRSLNWEGWPWYPVLVCPHGVLCLTFCLVFTRVCVMGIECGVEIWGSLLATSLFTSWFCNLLFNYFVCYWYCVLWCDLRPCVKYCICFVFINCMFIKWFLLILRSIILCSPCLWQWTSVPLYRADLSWCIPGCVVNYRIFVVTGNFPYLTTYCHNSI